MTDVELRGSDRLRRTLGQARRGLRTLDVGGPAREVVAEAARRAPRRTGALAASVSTQGPTVDAAGPAVMVGSRLPYAGVIESGWPAHSIRAQPFLGPAAQRQARPAATEAAREVQQLLNRVKGA